MQWLRLRITEWGTVLNPIKCSSSSAYMKQYEVHTLAPDGWHVTFGTAKMGLRRLSRRILIYKMPHTKAQCTNCHIVQCPLVLVHWKQCYKAAAVHQLASCGVLLISQLTVLAYMCIRWCKNVGHWLSTGIVSQKVPLHLPVTLKLLTNFWNTFHAGQRTFIF